MPLEHIKTHIIRANCFVEPSYAICTAYREETLLNGESFFIFQGNESEDKLFPKRLSVENYAGYNYPEKIDEGFFLSAALEMAEKEYRLKILEAYKQDSIREYSKWPLIKEVSEIPFYQLWLTASASIKNHLREIGKITRHTLFAEYIQELSPLTLRVREI